jgi:hypothetical protein
VTRRALIVGAGAAGAVGGVVTAIGFAIDPAQAAYSYLTAWSFAVSVALGALIFLLIGHATGARWTVVFQPFTEAIAGALPGLAVLFVPIAVAARALYPWADPARVAALEGDAAARLAHKAAYLDLGLWGVRAAVFLALWIAIAELIARWGRGDRGAGALARARALSAVALPAVALSLTFAAFDWLMSLTPLWYSTIFGLLYFSGGFVAALALIAVIAHAARRVPEVAAAIAPSHTGALGRLAFAFLVFWAYMEFSQGIIIWIADKPDEVPWYVARGAARWAGVFALLVVGHFALPFFALLPRAVKRRPAWLAVLGAWLVVMHYVDLYWMVMPALHATLALHWLDAAAPCAVLGLATCAAAARPRTRRMLAADHPQLAAALAYREAA